MPRLPQISGRTLIRLLHSFLEVTRVYVSAAATFAFEKSQRSESTTSLFPDHKILAKGTLSDILARVGLWNNIPKEELLKRLG